LSSSGHYKKGRLSRLPRPTPPSRRHSSCLLKTLQASSPIFSFSPPNFHGFFYHSIRMSAHKWKRTNYLNVKFVIVTQ
jgi:hypothetical protein